MLFIDPIFFVFIAIVLAVHWTLRSNTWRKAWLLLCSHIFYAGFFIGNTQSGTARTTQTT